MAHGAAASNGNGHANGNGSPPPSEPEPQGIDPRLIRGRQEWFETFQLQDRPDQRKRYGWEMVDGKWTRDESKWDGEKPIT